MTSREHVDTQLTQDMTQQLNTETAQTTPRAPLLDLSLTQLVAGSMAAATAAALGSRLGVVGTISGAAIGSVTSAIAASVYTKSMSHARHTLRLERLAPRLKGTNLLPPPGVAGEPPPVELVPTRATSATRRPMLGSRVLGGAAVVFALATAFLLGLQLASGTNVTGTSIGTRPPAASVNEPRTVMEVQADPTPTGTPTPTTDAPATEQPVPPDATPTETAPTPGPSGSTQPTRDTSPAPTDPGGVTQPPTEPSPTTPAG